MTNDDIIFNLELFSAVLLDSDMVLLAPDQHGDGGGQQEAGGGCCSAAGPGLYTVPGCGLAALRHQAAVPPHPVHAAQHWKYGVYK